MVIGSEGRFSVRDRCVSSAGVLMNGFVRLYDLLLGFGNSEVKSELLATKDARCGGPVQKGRAGEFRGGPQSIASGHPDAGRHPVLRSSCS